MSNIDIQLDSLATGEHGYSLINRVTYMLDRYEIEIEVTPDGKFVGIASIKVNKDFITQARRFANAQYHDVDAYYKDDAEE